MSDEGQEGATEHTPNHGIDANDKPGGGALNEDNPNDPRETDPDKETGQEATGASGGGEPTEPGGPGVRGTQKEPHGESGR